MDVARQSDRADDDVGLSTESLTKPVTLSSSTARKRRLLVCCSAVLARRARLDRVMYGLMLPGLSQSRTLISYFSESRYSSLPGIGSCSSSSKPL